MKAKSKSELAAAAGVSLDTLRKWLKACQGDLEAVGYDPRTRVLTPIISPNSEQLRRRALECRTFVLGKVSESQRCLPSLTGMPSTTNASIFHRGKGDTGTGRRRYSDG